MPYNFRYFKLVLMVKAKRYMFADEWDDELRLKRNQLDVLHAHNRFIQTREEINRRRSSLGLEPLRNENLHQHNSGDLVPLVDVNSNKTIISKDVKNGD